MQLDLNLLLEISENSNDSFYLEGKKENEIGYSKYHFKRFNELLSFIPTSKSKILDIGTTPFTLYLAKHSPHEVYTIDYSDGFRNRCYKEDVVFKQFDISKEGLPFVEDYFDVILFTEIFEHILADPVKTLAKLYKMLRENGLLIMSTPNLGSLLSRMKLLLNKPILAYPTWEIRQDSIHGHGHNRLYVAAELLDYHSKAGFRGIKVKYSSKGECESASHYGWTASFKEKVLKKFFVRPFSSIVPSFRATIYIFATK